MKNKILLIVIIGIVGCGNSDDKPFIQNKLNKNWLEKIINESDSIYKKPYFRRDFVTASYYVNKKNGTLCQVMRDSSENVRQVIMEKDSIRIFYAQFYFNGQATAILNLDKQGKFSGNAELFYQDGKTESKGKYSDGFRVGTWKIFDEKGKLIREEEYDSNGQLIKTTFAQ